MHDAGWAGISWPEEYGGRGATLIEQSIFNEELVRQRVPAPANVLGLVMGGPVVIAHGDEEQKERYLEPILSGDEIWCQGFSEPESGSDLASLKARAVKTNGSWKVTGQKVWTTYAHDGEVVHAARALATRTHPSTRGSPTSSSTWTSPGSRSGRCARSPARRSSTRSSSRRPRFPTRTSSARSADGWQVAITTLMFERAGLGAAAVLGLKRTMEDLTRGGSREGTRRRPGDPPADRRATDRDRGDAPRLTPRPDRDDEDRHPRSRGLAQQVAVGRLQPGADRARQRGSRAGGNARRHRLELPLPALPGELDRGRHNRGAQEHHRRARARPAEAAEAERPDELRL